MLTRILGNKNQHKLSTLELLVLDSNKTLLTSEFQMRQAHMGKQTPNIFYVRKIEIIQMSLDEKTQQGGKEVLPFI